MSGIGRNIAGFGNATLFAGIARIAIGDLWGGRL